jgi:hypothetical protein
VEQAARVIELLQREGFQKEAEEAAKCWEVGNAFEFSMSLPRALRARIEALNWQVTKGA